MPRTNLFLLVALTWLITSPPADAQNWKLGVGMVASRSGGVKIVQVFQDSPADLMGLKVGHTILALDGKLVNSPTEAREMIMTGSSPSISVLYTDGSGFYQKDAEFVVVGAIGSTGKYGSTARGKTGLKMKSLRTKKVADPRRKR